MPVIKVTRGSDLTRLNSRNEYALYGWTAEKVVIYYNPITQRWEMCVYFKRVCFHRRCTKVRNDLCCSSSNRGLPPMITTTVRLIILPPFYESVKIHTFWKTRFYTHTRPKGLGSTRETRLEYFDVTTSPDSTALLLRLLIAVRWCGSINKTKNMYTVKGNRVGKYS